MSSCLTSFKKFLKSLGPGIISGGADDDPSAIATFSQAGAQFGFGLLWTAIYLYPILISKIDDNKEAKDLSQLILEFVLTAFLNMQNCFPLSHQYTLKRWNHQYMNHAWEIPYLVID